MDRIPFSFLENERMQILPVGDTIPAITVMPMKKML